MGDNAAFEHDGVLVQHDGIGAGEVGRSLAFVRDPRFVGAGFFAGEAPNGLTTVYGDPISADVFVYWRDPDDPMAQEVLVGATKSAPDGTWCITGLNYNLRYVVRARAFGCDDVTVVGVQPSRSDVIAYVDQLVPREDEFGDVDGLTGHVFLDSGLPPFTCEVIQPLPYGLTARIEGRKLLIEGVSIDNGLWESVVRVTASNGVWVDVPVQVQIQVLHLDPHWEKVVSLLDFDTDFSDIKGEAWIAKPSNVAIQSALKKFGQGALQVSGRSANVFYSTGVASNWSTQDFTVEGWVNHSSTSADYKNIFVLGDGYSAFTFVVGMTNENKIYMSVAGKGVAATVALPAGGWHHLAFVRSNGSRFALYLDGVELVSLTHTAALINRPRFHLCSNERAVGAATFTGAIDEVRITLGVARYTANFTPPSTYFPRR